MKKSRAVLFLSLMMLLLLAGCSRQTAETVSEPDTSTRTQVRAIEQDQMVVYRFHMDKLRSSDNRIKLTLLDRNEDAGEQARNWCTAVIGHVPNLGAGGAPLFLASSAQAKDAGWDFSNGPDPSWKLLIPENIDDLESADMRLTLSRKGETVRVTLDIDGARAWDAQQTIGNFGEETRYFYLSVENCALSEITFSDAGAAGWIPPTWLRVIIMAVLLIAAFIVHLLAKKIAGDRVFITEDGLAPASGVWVLSLVLFGVLLLARSGSPISRNLYFLPFALPVEGTAFWITAAVLGLIALGIAGFLIWLAVSDLENPLKYLFCALVCGVFHAAWYASLVFVFLSLLGQIIELIATCLLVVVACALIHAFLKTSEVKPVIKTTRIYNKYTGDTISEKSEIDFVIVPKDDNKE